MASEQELGCEVGGGAAVPAVAAGSWPLVCLQQLAEKAAEAKASFIRKRLGNEALQVSCKCPVLM